jgi:hypothetical protein
MTSLQEKYPIGSRWLDTASPKDNFVVVGHDRRAVLIVNEGSVTVERFLRDYLADYAPYVEPKVCPDFERYLVWDPVLHKADGFSLDKLNLVEANRAEFVFLAGVRDGEPFIERVKG